jgi:hypothetical protein
MREDAASWRGIRALNRLSEGEGDWLTEDSAHLISREIARRSLLRRQVMQENIRIPSATVSLRIAGLRRQLRLKTDLEFEHWLASNAMTERQLWERVQELAAIDILQRQIIGDSAVQARFLSRKPELDQLLFGIIRLGSRAQAYALHERMTLGGEDFFRLACEHSTDAQAAQGGLMGPLSPLQISPTIRQSLASLSVGEMSPVLQTGEHAFIILRLLRRDIAALTPELADSIRQELFERWIEDQLQQAAQERQRDWQQQQPEVSASATKPPCHCSETTRKSRWYQRLFTWLLR